MPKRIEYRPRYFKRGHLSRLLLDWIRQHGSESFKVATIRSNCRWCSVALEFTAWNGEVVRVAFALDCHDREAISWVATTAGISGEMIRDMMVRCVEQRFGTRERLRRFKDASE